VSEAAKEKQPTGFAAAALLLALSAVLSRLLGLVRERVIAHQIGATHQADAYGAAFLIPDMLNYFLAGGALAIAFIPLYSSVRARSGDAAAGELFASVFGTMTAVAVLATVVLWWQATELVAVFFAGFDADTQLLTVRLVRILLPAQIFFVAGGVLRAVLMARGRFASQALGPLIYNAGIILAGGLWGARFGPEAFAWGALAGAALGPFAIPMFEVWRDPALRPRVRIAPLDPMVLRYLAMAAPIMLGVSLLTVDEWYERWFGALLEPGTVARLGYARQLMLAPVAVAGQAIAAAALPTLSLLWSEKRISELDTTLLNTLRTGVGLAALGAAALFALSEPLVAFVYQHGRFTAADTEVVAALLRILSFAVPGWILQQIAVRAFFARSDTWRPMLLATGVALLAIPLYLALGPRFGAEGLAAAGVIAMSCNALLTLLYARHLHGAPDLRALAATACRAFVIAGAAAFAAAWSVEAWMNGAASLLQLAVGGAAFAVTALLGARLIGDPPIREAIARITAIRRRSG